MLLGVFILTLFIFSSGGEKLADFVRYVESSEKFDFVNFINLSNNSENLDFFNNVHGILTPRMIFSKFLKPLKLYFDSKQLTVVSVDEHHDLNTAFEILKFNENSKIIIISSTLNPKQTLQTFGKHGFINSIFVDPIFFKEAEIFYSFEMFPKFALQVKRINQSENIFPDKVHNIYGYPVKISFTGSIAGAMVVYDQNKNKLVYMGFRARILQSFVEFLNGTFDVIFNRKTHDVSYESLSSGAADFATIQYYPPPKSNISNIIFRQNCSDSIDLYKVMIIVPTPERLHRQFYPFKPFTIEVWMLTIGLLFYTTVLITAVRPTTTGSSQTFWSYFGKIQRALFAQSFSYSEERHHRKIYLLPILIGFMLTTWYNALLGSFLTTTLSETPIRCVDDIRKKNLTILCQDSVMPLWENMEGFTKYLPYIRPLDGRSLLLSELKLNRTFAFTEVSFIWNQIHLPQMKFYNDMRFKELDDVLVVSDIYMNINHNSVYKERFNRFIYLIRDVGLYKFWSENTFMDILKYKPLDVSLNSSKIPAIRPIHLGYFLHVYWFWSAGMVCALIAFIGEIFMKKGVKDLLVQKKQRKKKIFLRKKKGKVQPRRCNNNR